MAPGESPPDGDSRWERASRNGDVALARITRGVAALREENRQLRLELAQLHARRPDEPTNGGVPAGTLTQIVLPADRRAPSSARTLLDLCVGGLVDARVLSDAQLLISELVTNSIVHSGIGARDEVVVRIRLGSEALELEVRNKGVTGTIASNGGDPERGRGFGLDLVGLLSADWGVRRDGDTTVWAEVSRKAG